MVMQNPTNASNAERTIGAKVIEEEKLDNFAGPLKKSAAIIGAFGLSVCAMFLVPTWRWKWRQRVIFNKYCHGKVVDLVPVIGDDKRQQLFEFSRAVVVDLAGRRPAVASTSASSSSESNDDNNSNNSSINNGPEGSRAHRSMSYQLDEVEARYSQEEEHAQEVDFDMLREATGPTSALALSDVTFNALDITKAVPRSYDTAVITNALCWEDAVIAKDRLAFAWTLVKPGGHLLVIDYGRPQYEFLQKVVDWAESHQLLSLRLQTDWYAWMQENLVVVSDEQALSDDDGGGGGLKKNDEKKKASASASSAVALDEPVWPPALSQRRWFGVRYVIALEKKEQQEKTMRTPEPKSSKK